MKPEAETGERHEFESNTDGSGACSRAIGPNPLRRCAQPRSSPVHGEGEKASRTHICGDPNEACDTECMHRAYEFEAQRKAESIASAIVDEWERIEGESMREGHRATMERLIVQVVRDRVKELEEGVQR